MNYERKAFFWTLFLILSQGETPASKAVQIQQYLLNIDRLKSPGEMGDLKMCWRIAFTNVGVPLCIKAENFDLPSWVWRFPSFFLLLPENHNESKWRMCKDTNVCHLLFAMYFFFVLYYTPSIVHYITIHSTWYTRYGRI